MTSSNPLSPLPSIPSVLVIAVLAGTIGLLSGGLRGLQAGWVAGLMLPFVPFCTTRTWTWLTQPEGLPRLIGREVAASIVRVSSSTADRIGDAVSPLADAATKAFQPPALVVRLGVAILAGSLGSLVSGLFRRIATPLGLANLGALAIIVGDFAGLSVASLACFGGLPALILVLLVNESEERSARY